MAEKLKVRIHLKSGTVLDILCNTFDAVWDRDTSVLTSWKYTGSSKADFSPYYILPSAVEAIEIKHV